VNLRFYAIERRYWQDDFTENLAFVAVDRLRPAKKFTHISSL